MTYEYGTTADTAENQVGRVKLIVDDAGQETRSSPEECVTRLAVKLLG
ncbi:MAG: hypothetical protein WCC48_09450 [Anaeromyxobacteraceae bacterium]